jgi:broad specificity phosphatase PhoE
MKIRTLSFIMMAVAVAAASARAQAPTWAIIVRHAEKAAAPADDPEPSAEGMQRAKLLMERLHYTVLDAIITTQFKRTQHTAALTATDHRVPLTFVPTTVANHAQAVADEVKKHAGKVVLVVGHSNTVPDIIAALGAPKPRAICDTEYDRLFIVMMPATGTPSVVETRYGAPTPAEAACTSMR